MTFRSRRPLPGRVDGQMAYLWANGTSMEGMADHFGVMINPTRSPLRQGVKEGRHWALDNGCFIGDFDPGRFFHVLEMLDPYLDRCLFLTCPDVVGDARATLKRWSEWADILRHYGPVAFVAQDGQEDLELPSEMDWLFVGGSTDWKMGQGARSCIQWARERDIPVHVGRVNSIKRLAYFKSLDCQSADGTRSVFAPTETERRINNAIWQQQFDFDVFD